MTKHVPKKFMWVVEKNDTGHPLLEHCDVAFLELWSHGKDGLRQFIIDGEGNLWFPSLEGSPRQAEPLGKLLLVMETDCDERTRAKALASCRLEGKRVNYFPAND